MHARYRRIRHALGRHIKLLQQWLVLRAYGFSVKKRKGFLVIDGNFSRRPLRCRLILRTALRHRRTAQPSLQTATEARHEL